MHFLESPSPLNPLGVKGVGESGCVPAAGAIVAAIEDALSPFGVTIGEYPVTPAKLFALIDAARQEECSVTSVGLIGYGGIAQDVVSALRGAENGVEIVGALCRPGRADKARAALPGIQIVESLDALLARGPEVVAEVAGQKAVAEYGPAVLLRRVDLLVISIGALAEPKLLEALGEAALEGGSRILLPAGAIGGIDAIAAMRVGGLDAVRYRSRKPPAAWRGSPAEKVADLDKLSSAHRALSRHRRRSGFALPAERQCGRRGRARGPRF